VKSIDFYTNSEISTFKLERYWFYFFFVFLSQPVMWLFFWWVLNFSFQQLLISEIQRSAYRKNNTRTLNKRFKKIILQQIWTIYSLTLELIKFNDILVSVFVLLFFPGWLLWFHKKMWCAQLCGTYICTTSCTRKAVKFEQLNEYKYQSFFFFI
jgi:hypothetical protein